MTIVCDKCKKKMNDEFTFNDVKEYFNSTYERTGDPKDIIQAKDIYDEFTQSDTWHLFTYNQRQMWGKRRFIRTLCLTMGLDFKQRIKGENGATIRSVWRNWRKKSTEFSETLC